MRSAVLLLVACGRVGFDERVLATDGAPDVMRVCDPLTTHDEDSDGVVDSCDVCPHIAGAQTDGDGDGVGDDCDIDPEVPRQRIVAFDPFTSIAGWNTGGVVTPTTDRVKLGGLGQQAGRLSKTFVPSVKDAYTIGVRTATTGGGPQHLFAIMFAETLSAGGQTVYCEHIGDSVDAALLMTYTLDGSSFLHPGSVVAPVIANSTGSLTAFIDPNRLSCTLIWNAVGFGTGAPRPAEVVPQFFSLYAENIELELDYFLQIRTDP